MGQPSKQLLFFAVLIFTVAMVAGGKLDRWWWMPSPVIQDDYEYDYFMARQAIPPGIPAELPCRRMHQACDLDMSRGICCPGMGTCTDTRYGGFCQ